jgi:predicted acylesterase/phospholipase RssA
MNQKMHTTSFQINIWAPEKIIQCIMASSAIPKVFQSVKLMEKITRMVMLKINVPVSILKMMGCDLIFVIPLSEYGAPSEDTILLFL